MDNQNNIIYDSRYAPFNNYDRYDTKGNPLEIFKENGFHTSYFWGYDNTYPIIKAENINTTDLTQVINASTSDLPALLNIIGDMTTEMQKTIWKNFNTSLRSNSLAANTLITTYTYKPLVGITSSTDPAGIATYYEYDPFGRLSIIRDAESNIIKKYDYHYAGQEEKK